jgi:cold shock CspA family protein
MSSISSYEGAEEGNSEALLYDARTFGRIKAVKNTFGFIVCEDDNTDYFFHCSELLDDTEWSSLYLGMYVSFELGERNGRSCAVMVKVEQ